MPCNSGMGDSGTDWEAHRRLKMVEAVLCGVIRHLTRGHPDDMTWTQNINWQEVGVSQAAAIALHDYATGR